MTPCAAPCRTAPAPVVLFSASRRHATPGEVSECVAQPQRSASLWITVGLAAVCAIDSRITIHLFPGRVRHLWYTCEEWLRVSTSECQSVSCSALRCRSAVTSPRAALTRAKRITVLTYRMATRSGPVSSPCGGSFSAPPPVWLGCE